MHQRLDSRPQRIFFSFFRGGIGREREIELRGGGALDVMLEVEKVGGGLEVDAAVVG